MGFESTGTTVEVGLSARGIGSAVGGNSRHRPSPPAAGVHWKRNAWARAACPSWATKRESTMKTWHDVKPTPKRRKKSH